MSALNILVAMSPEMRSQFFRAQDWAALEALGTVDVLDTPHDYRDEQARDQLRVAEVIVTGWGTDIIDSEALSRAPELKAVVHTGGSVRTIVTADVYPRGVRVSSQTAANSEPVAEYTVAMIMLAAKDVFRSERLYRQLRDFVDRGKHFPRAGLFGRRIGIVGLSRISLRVIDLLRPYRVEIDVYSRHLSPERAAELGVRPVPLDELMRTCEVISLHSASLPSTRHMIDDQLLALIQDGATLINTARGALIDQDALIRELATGRFDAILDVADPDVTVPDSPLWDMPNVILTPHFAGAVGHELYRLGQSAVEDVEDFAAGREMAGEIDAAQYEKQA
jgi:phosphoglycerate dehydrogenase-like enzyme